MAKSHPALFDEQDAPRFNQWARNTVASFALLACLASLSIILHNQYGVRFARAFVDGISALDLTQLVMQPLEQPAPVVLDPNERQYRTVGEYLARRYRVSSEMATSIVAKSYAVGHGLKLDPMLILAVISVESRFNPIAESTMGAKGLMQVIPRFHIEKFDPFGGEKVAFEPEANIMVGAKILKEYIRRTGDLADALQMYAGAASEESENGYSAKVMTERDRLHYVLRQHQNQNRTVVQPQPAIKSLVSAL
jgi:soluble lytic murein transglycosylase-like protein